MAQFFIPELRSVWHCNRRAREILAPILSERVVREKSRDYKKPLDSIEWFREYVPILRQEIDDILREVGGKWTMESMGQLQKLDSFIKETLRHSGHLTRE